jgi:hypothetical protein
MAASLLNPIRIIPVQADADTETALIRISELAFYISIRLSV